MATVHNRTDEYPTETPGFVPGHLALLDELGTKVASGALPEGQVITLAGLESELNASRTAVREVIKVLENLGMVRSKRRVGITVQPRTSWSILDPQLISWRMANPEERQAFFGEMSELRRGIEPEAARLAASRASRDLALQLRDMAIRMRELGSQGQGAGAEFLRARQALPRPASSLFQQRDLWPHGSIDRVPAHRADPLGVAALLPFTARNGRPRSCCRMYPGTRRHGRVGSLLVHRVSG